MAATALDHISLGGRIDWLSNLDTAFQPTKNYRRTSIVREDMTPERQHTETDIRR
jgi:hypothetical protein